MSAVAVLKGVLHSTYQGAVKGGKEALLSSLIARWGHALVGLDWTVTCTPEWGKDVSWWKRQLHSLIPSELFRESFFKQMESHKYTPVMGGWGGPKPAYGTVGNKGKGGTGLQCIDGKMAVTVGIVNLPRLIRTETGREVFQHQLIKEQEAILAAVDDDFCVAGAD